MILKPFLKEHGWADTTMARPFDSHEVNDICLHFQFRHMAHTTGQSKSLSTQK